MQTSFHSHYELSSCSSREAERSPSGRGPVFLGAPPSVLPQQTAVCPHQPSNLPAASRSSGVGISRSHLPAQAPASSLDLPFSAQATQKSANLPKIFPRTASYHWLWSLIVTTGRNPGHAHGLHCSLGRVEGLGKPGMRQRAGLKALQGCEGRVTSSLQADPRHNTKHEGSHRGRCRRRKTAPLAALPPPALIPELSTGFGQGDVSTDPPFASAPAAGEGTQKRHDPATHPVETHPTAGRGTRVCGGGRSRRQSPAAAASSLLPPKTGRQHPPGDPEAQAAKAVTASCQCHMPSSSLQADRPAALRQRWAGCRCPPVPARISLSAYWVATSRAGTKFLNKTSKKTSCQINMFKWEPRIS